MQPAQLAALLARETQEGVAGALSAIDSPRLLVLERITARVAGVPEEGAGTGTGSPDPPDWSAITWQAQAQFRVDPTARAQPEGPVLLPVLAALPVRALHGAGEVWAPRLADAGLQSLGDLATASSLTLVKLITRYGRHAAVLAARAQACSLPWVPSLTATATANAGRTVLAVAKDRPESLAGDPDDRMSLWMLCVQLTAAVDGAVLGRLDVAALPPETR